MEVDGRVLVASAAGLVVPAVTAFIAMQTQIASLDTRMVALEATKEKLATTESVDGVIEQTEIYMRAIETAHDSFRERLDRHGHRLERLEDRE